VSTRRVVLLALLFGLFVVPAALAAGPAKPPATPVQITPVGRLPFPERGYVIDLPTGVAIGSRAVHVSENAIGIGEFSFEALSASGVSYGSILAIDASDSMRGAPEAGALSAARTFIGRRTATQQVGVLAFNGSLNLLQRPTIDAGRLHSALQSPPRISYGTRLFDAVTRSLQTLSANKISAGSIILLSDGADIGSKSTLEQVVSAARRQHVRVFTVGLRSGAYDPTTLKSIAARTGGVYAEATSAKQLAGIYSQLGNKLSREYLLTYRSLAAPGAIVDVSVALDGVGSSAARYTAPTPSELPPYHRPFIRRFLLSGWSLLLLALVAAALIAGAVRLLIDAARSRFVDRVRAFATESLPDVDTQKRDSEDWRHRAARARVSSSAAARGWLGRLDEQLDIGRIRVSSISIVVLTAVATFLAVVLLGAISPFFALLGLGTPLVTRAWIRWRVNKVRFDFSEQLPPNLQVLASALRAGYTLLAALVATIDNAGEPSQSELARAIADEQLGVPLEEALRRVAKRMASRDLEQVAMLAELVRTTGGNAAEVLDVIVLTVRDRQDVRRLVRTLTAQGRMARWILTLLPIVTGLAFWALQPDIVGPMWHTAFGQFFLLVAAIMVATGSIVIQKIIEIEV
jgi:tight adherence protein B